MTNHDAQPNRSVSGLTPPPSPPLDGATRQRMRNRVLREASSSAVSESPRRQHRRLAPVTAVLAVVATTSAGLALGVGHRLSDDPSPGAGGPPVQVASHATPSDQPQPQATSSPYASTMPIPDSSSASPAQRTTCAQEIRAIRPDAREALRVPGAGGSTTTFYVVGDRWLVCDDSGELATVQGPRPLATRPLSIDDVRVSDSPGALRGTHLARTFLAAGAVPSGAAGFDATWSFPDGHTEKAEVFTDTTGRTWWRMQYTPTRGPLTDAAQQLGRLPEIEVSVVAPGASTWTRRLAWHEDTCAQVNHGC